MDYVIKSLEVLRIRRDVLMKMGHSGANTGSEINGTIASMRRIVLSSHINELDRAIKILKEHNDGCVNKDDLAKKCEVHKKDQCILSVVTDNLSSLQKWDASSGGGPFATSVDFEKDNEYGCWIKKEDVQGIVDFLNDYMKS